MPSFVLIVADHDNRQFAVEGPMVDDSLWNKAVGEVQKQGRDVRCHVPGGPARLSVEIAAKGYSNEFGYEQLGPGAIVARPSPW